jgi:copper(I)-binding protein
MKLTRGLFAVTLVFLPLLSCRGEGDPGSSSIRIGEGWVRAMPLLEGAEGVGTNSAAYLLLRNEGATGDRLLGAESPCASRVEIHESSMEGEVMRMRKVDELEIPPRSEVELKPGGLHLMLLGLTGPLIEGEEVDLTLHFRGAGDRPLRLPVRSGGGR